MGSAYGEVTALRKLPTGQKDLEALDSLRRVHLGRVATLENFTKFLSDRIETQQQMGSTMLGVQSVLPSAV